MTENLKRQRLKGHACTYKREPKRTQFNGQKLLILMETDTTIHLLTTSGETQDNAISKVERELHVQWNIDNNIKTIQSNIPAIYCAF